MYPMPVSFPSFLNYSELTEDQAKDKELKPLLAHEKPSNLQRKSFEIPTSKTQIICDVSTSKARPYITLRFQSKYLT